MCGCVASNMSKGRRGSTSQANSGPRLGLGLGRLSLDGVVDGAERTEGTQAESQTERRTDECNPCQYTPTDFPEKKRADCISWDEYFMGLAVLSSYRSKDPRTQVGACVVNPDKRVTSLGYNGMPNGCSDDEFPWKRRTGDEPIENTKDAYGCCAELNAIMNSSHMEKGSTLYVTLFPCCYCAKLILQTRKITEVVYIGRRYSGKYQASERMFRAAKVKFREFKSQRDEIIIDFTNHR